MGEQVSASNSDAGSMKDFTRHLLRDFRALQQMWDQGLFETGIERIGAEQEIALVDKHWSAAPMAMEILADLEHPNIVNEYARFNLECNLDPQRFTGDCFSKMHRQLSELLRLISEKSAKYGVDFGLVGILPTLRQRDLTYDNMTPLDRYRILSDNLKRLRGGKNFNFYINGTDELIAEHASSLLESCNTSFQVHLQVSHEDFIDKYNFAQLVSAPLLASACNSSLLFGKRLWKETRIALFQQSIDTRQVAPSAREQSPRVTFGKGWVRNSIMEIFTDDLARFRLIMSTGVDENSLETLRNGGVPRLRALSLFNGTVYRWNRACYGITNGKPHLRIENRVLPSGPTPVDEIANAAFWLGMMRGMPDQYRKLYDRMAFDLAQSNFINAAKMGLDTKFDWLNGQNINAQDLILEELLPMAREGLAGAGVNEDDRTKYLDIIEERVKLRRTGSLWLFESFNKLLNDYTRFEAAVTLTAGMIRRQKKDRPIHTWELAGAKDADVWRRRYWRVEQIMVTDLYTINETDLVDLAARLMDWKYIRHIPVEDEAGKLVGMITMRMLHAYLGEDYVEIKDKAVKEIMKRDLITITPNTLTLDALKLMRTHNLSYLPVVEEDRLVGMITEHDFTKISDQLLQELARKHRRELESVEKLNHAGSGNPGDPDGEDDDIADQT